MKLEDLLEEKELAKFLKVSRVTLLDYRHRGLPWLKIGGRVYYDQSEFLGWILKNQKRVSDSA